MRIAVCFSGQIRTGVEAFPNIKNYIGELWDNCMFFCHTWNNNTRKPYNANGVHREGYLLEHETFAKFTELYSLHGKFVIEDYDKIFEQKKSTAWNPMHYSWRRSIEVLHDFQKATNLEFNLVVKIRPDLLLRPSRKMGKEIANFLLKNDKDGFFAESTYSGPSGIIDDVMYFAVPAVMNKASMFAYDMEDGSVQGLKTYLQQKDIKLGCTVQDLPELGYAVLREESLGKNVINDWQGCYEDDMFYYQPK